MSDAEDAPGTVTRILIVAGGGDYTDPWHAFDDTSEALRDLVSGAGRDVVVATRATEALAGLAAQDGAGWDLLVLNVGSAEQVRAGDVACVDGLERFVAGGGAILAVHSSASVFPADGRWEEILGGRWVSAVSMHPDLSVSCVHVAPSGHPVAAMLEDFEVADERYSFLRVDPAVEVLVQHELDGVMHPLVWARTVGRGRVVYDGLGHDVRSYASEGHRALVRASVDWLVEASGA